ncbi:hypothetical protein JQS43_03845 [Natronosporangium hydrolyticum]|uniref:Uncharacterized protein n=1 Tax=Natronosporangium hydrolyticum TaxID=2811111 RepID=A0A895YLE2_9ACTN|nr:hypothetical protein [Natronosporangium hydrolyticum]QSB15496.1 hypothetical protein JQS43_03845 [Natronosporangium hydrolyticum]
MRTRNLARWASRLVAVAAFGAGATLVGSSALAAGETADDVTSTAGSEAVYEPNDFRWE